MPKERLASSGNRDKGGREGSSHGIGGTAEECEGKPRSFLEKGSARVRGLPAKIEDPDGSYQPEKSTEVSFTGLHYRYAARRYSGGAQGGQKWAHLNVHYFRTIRTPVGGEKGTRALPKNPGTEGQRRGGIRDDPWAAHPRPEGI